MYAGVLGDEDPRPAQRALRVAVQKGLLVGPAACPRCGAASGSLNGSGRPVKIHAHHYRGYAREHWLDVRWLCSGCHPSVETTDAYARALPAQLPLLGDESSG